MVAKLNTGGVSSTCLPTVIPHNPVSVISIPNVLRCVHGGMRLPLVTMQDVTVCVRRNPPPTPPSPWLPCRLVTMQDGTVCAWQNPLGIESPSGKGRQENISRSTLFSSLQAIWFGLHCRPKSTSFSSLQAMWQRRRG